jgi:hypothetical protein
MRRTLVLAVIALTPLAGCKGSGDGASGSSGAAPKAGAPKTKAAPKAKEAKGPKAVNGAWKKVPNIKGVLADVPAAAKPNGFGGAAGFHSDGRVFDFMLRKTKVGADPKAAFEKAKKDAESIAFKKWIKSEKTKEGWVLTWTMPKVAMKKGEAEIVGTLYSFEVVSKVGGEVYKCYGAVAKKEHLEPVLRACSTLRKG